MRIDLAPVRALLGALGDPQRALSVVHIAGSKGKGSTALFTEALLRALGERVGTFTSPHLLSWTERFRLDGEPLSDDALARLVERVRPAVQALRAGPPQTRPTWFDVTTAVALLCFAEAGVDRAVLEVGLGGRLDSTNVVRADVACITAIELEHTAVLGDTLAAIAGEKAGILEPGRPAVVGALAPEPLAVVEARAKDCGAALAVLGRDVSLEVTPAAEAAVHLRCEDGPLRVESDLAALGAHQAHNAALALACVRRLDAHAVPALAAAARAVLPVLMLPGRAEVIGAGPRCVVDAAHTPASAAALRAILDALGGARLHLVLSVSVGKDVDGVLAALLPAADAVTVTRAEPTRSLHADALAGAVRAMRPDLPLCVEPDAVRAVQGARATCAPEDVLCATGSIYLAGIARAALGASA